MRAVETAHGSIFTGRSSEVAIGPSQDIRIPLIPRLESHSKNNTPRVLGLLKLLPKIHQLLIEVCDFLPQVLNLCFQPRDAFVIGASGRGERLLFRRYFPALHIASQQMGVP